MLSRRASVAIALTCAAILIPVFQAGAGVEPPRPALGPRDLWTGLAPRLGWGFDAETNITDPGPTITTMGFEIVSFTLFSTDVTHRFVLDLDGSGTGNGGEPQSPDFGPTPTGTPYTFATPNLPGTYSYVCGIHGPTQRGTWIVVGGNAPPTVSLTNPDGITVNRWTGGSTHRLTWTMDDPDGLPSQLSVWLNYTSSAGSGVIGIPPIGSTSFDWVLPTIDAADVTVQIEVVDTGGATANDAELVPIIDSTLPSVDSTVPLDTAVGVDPNDSITITFSEEISVLGPGTIALTPPAGTLNLNWNPANTVVTVGHAPLQPSTLYVVDVSDWRDISNPGNPMAPFSFSFTTANEPPVITVSQPVATSRWTGNTMHDLQWTVTDAEDPAASLSVWVNYSVTGNPPFSPISGLQGVPGDTTSFSWNVPMDNTTTAKLEFSALDTGGAETIQLSVPFSIDSAAPTVGTTFPSNGQPNVPTNTNLVITFSEAMNESATGNAQVVALQGPSSWVPLSFSWNGTILTADPVPSNLAANTPYDLRINASARDASDPGLTLGSPVVVSFTTGSVPDTSSPVLSDVAAIPSSAVPGSFVEISANVTDDTAVSTVSAAVTLPDSSFLNLTMTPGAGNRWSVTQAWSQSGTHAFVVWASDTSGNWASDSGSFTIAPADTTRPVLSNVAATPSSATTGTSVEISANVTDDTAVNTVSVLVRQPDSSTVNVTMTLGSGTRWAVTRTWSQAGTHTFVVWASDASGNWGSGGGSFSMVAPDTSPPLIAHTPPGPHAVGSAIHVIATVTDPSSVAQVRLVYTPVGGTELNVTMTPSGGGLYNYTIPAQSRAGTVRYRIYAIDALGNEVITQEYPITISEPPTVNVVLYVGLALVAILALGVVYFLLRRKRKSGPG